MTSFSRDGIFGGFLRRGDHKITDRTPLDFQRRGVLRRELARGDAETITLPFLSA